MYNKCTIYVNNYLLNKYNKIYKIPGTYLIESTLMSFYVYLIRNSCCSDSTLISSAINTEKFTFSAGVLLKFQVFWNVALSPLASSLRHFECRRVFLFRVQESRSNFIRHGSSKLIILKFFGNTWQVNQVIEMSLHIQEISVKENNSRIGLNQCFESNFNT